MTLTIALLVVMGAVETWAFLYSSPKLRGRRVAVFNGITLCIAVGLSIGFAVSSYFDGIDGSDHSVWPAIAALRALVIFCAVFFIAAPIRFLIFRRGASDVGNPTF